VKIKKQHGPDFQKQGFPFFFLSNLPRQASPKQGGLFDPHQEGKLTYIMIADPTH
jgi:hypothetical protein